jgi:hypothetical protein
MRQRLLNFTVELPPGWCDITGELPGSPPPTVGKSRGVGALQFSQAEFEGGEPMHLTAEDLLDMVKGIAAGADSTISFDEQTDASGPLRVGAVSMALEGNFVRLWGVCDGRGVVIATYTCNWRERRPDELAECRRVIESIRIVPPAIVGIA